MLRFSMLRSSMLFFSWNDNQKCKEWQRETDEEAKWARLICDLPLPDPRSWPPRIARYICARLPRMLIILLIVLLLVFGGGGYFMGPGVGYYGGGGLSLVVLLVILYLVFAGRGRGRL
jgi:hypothetical protein